MDINKAYQLLEDFPFLQTARIAKVIQGSNGSLTEHDKLELYLYRGNPFLLSYQLKNKTSATYAVEHNEEILIEEENETYSNAVLEEEKSTPIELSIDAETIAIDTNDTVEDIDTDINENIPAPIAAVEENNSASITVAEDDTEKQENITTPEVTTIPTPTAEDNLYEPLYVSDIFMHDGIKVENEIDNNFVEQEQKKKDAEHETEETSLMVTRTFVEWLHYYKEKKKKDEKETREKESLRAMWQKEKLTAAIEEENEVVPEQVFKMAINSISDDMIVPSESLAAIYINQQKYDKAIEMYRKLSLLNPEKSAYFASKIKNISQ